MSLLLDLPGLALVAGVLVLGLGLASGGPPWLTLGERLVIGLVIAVVGITMIGYLLALAIGVTVGLALLLAAMALLVGGMLLIRHRRRVRTEVAPRSWGLPLALALVALAMGYLFARAVEVTPSAWLAHYGNTWSDWSFHASYATTFVYGHNLPPQNPLFAGTPFRYTFAPDFASAVLIGAGWSIPAALIWPSWAMTVLALSGLILWARRLTGGIGAGVIAVTLTLLGGGLGFWLFFGDAGRLGLINALTHIPQTYDRPPVDIHSPLANIQWYNPILSYYLPQRSFVFGAAIVMTVLLLVTPPLLATPFFHWRETWTRVRQSWRRWTLNSEAVAFVVAGALVGLLPLFHVHSLVVLGIVTGCWALLFPRPAWIGFFAVMLLLAVPRLLMAVPGDPGASPEHQYPRWLLGWLSGTDFPVWFWIKNTGLFWPLLLIALLSPLALNRRARLVIAPFSLVFLVGNLIKFQPWDWDNTKILVFWYMASGVAVGALLVRIWRVALPGAAAALVLWLTLVASGGLSLLQVLPPQGPSYVWFSAEDLQLAAEVRRLTPPKAIFVTAADPNNEIAAYPNNPVADLAGRSILMGYPGWLWSYGINYIRREADIRRIYDGGATALELLHHYHADYVVIGPNEMATLHPNLDYFNTDFRLALHTAHYEIYAVPPP
ncbi:MAG TPA: hypothetical protein VG104_05015 [Candidatus Dormibacteraeota bacterium]|nr:hypothetical protein [Candidatus Dormibacteraeota bacterium]